MIKLKIDKKVFNPIYLKHMMNNQKRQQIYYGGSSSGKSFSLAQRTVLDVLEGRNYLIVRNIGATLKKSVFNEINKAITNFKVREYFNINKSELVITCNLNNAQILFSGLDDVEKLKSITPIEGVITDIWVEEATECEYKDIKQLEKRLRGRSKFTKRMTFSFNPVLQTSWLYKEYFDIWQDDKQYVENDQLSILKTTYKDNKFLTEDDIYGLETETDKYYYEVYTLGNWGVLGAVIFKNWTVKEFDKEMFGRYYHGLDWGFSNDPLAYVRSGFDRPKKTIYICDEIYETELLNDASAPRVRAYTKGEVVITDVNPQNVADYNRLGTPARAAKKGPGSIEAGINWLKQFNIVIHPDCKNFKEEISKYKYKEDKNGNVLPIAVDKDNHLMDALRYAYEPVMLSKEIKVRDRKRLGL